jgi:hypothetical protein
MHSPLLAKDPRRDAGHRRQLTAAVLWLLAGSFLLITTLLPAYTEMLGWTPAFWLMGAPLAVLLTLEPSLPRQLLALRRTRRTATRALMWH